MDHIQEKRKSVRTSCFVPAKVSEISGRERLVRVTDLNLEGCKIVCASGMNLSVSGIMGDTFRQMRDQTPDRFKSNSVSSNLNLQSDVTITVFEEQIIRETDSNGVEYEKIQMVGVTPILGTVQRWFSRNPDSSVRVYGIKFNHTIDHSHYIRKLIADSSH